MVDTALRRENGAASHETTDTTSAATAFGASKEVISSYGDFARKAVVGPSQSPGWVTGWMESMGADLVLAKLTVSGQIVLALALEVCQEGPFRVARFPGGKHANGNFPACDRVWLAEASAADIRELINAIRAARRDIDVVSLERLISDIDGLPNPLLTLPSTPSPNIVLACDLTSGFDALHSRNSNRKRKRRNQQRKYEAAGGWRRVMATTEAETNAMLDAFFAMTEKRFATKGITNVFAPADVRKFFRGLFAGALEQEKPGFFLHGLEVTEKYRAIIGSSRVGGRITCEFCAIADDDLTHTSPGSFLFFDNIEEACNQGYDIYDFSVGDERYKRQWYNIEIRHADVLVPLTVKGRLYALGAKASSRIKAAIKGNQVLWAIMKRLRAGARGKAAPVGED